MERSDMKYRRERLEDLIQEELNNLILRELEFSGLLVTITGVEIDKKLNRAVVNFSVLSPCAGCPMGSQCQDVKSQKDFDLVLKIFEKNRSHLQYLLMKKINVKPMPQIIFKIDRGLEKAAEVEKLLFKDKIK
jgi:ribosome-binding factor A